MTMPAETQLMVSIIIPTYNRRDSILRTLESLRQQTYPAQRFEVIAVDDGGRDGTEEIAGRTYPFTLRYIRQENQGEIVARNAGADVSVGDVLIFLDDDIEVNRMYIEAVADVHRHYPRAVVLGTLIEVPLEERVGHLSEANTYQTHRDPVAMTFVDCMSGILSMPRDGFFEIGAMQPLRPGEGRNIWGGIDLGYRAEQLGFAFWRAPSAVAIHHDNAILSLASRCRRNQRVSHAVHDLYAKHPGLRGQIPMFEDKGPIAWHEDTPRRILRKVARQISASRPAMWLLERGASSLEHRAPDTLMARLFSRWLVSGYIYRGYREGLHAFQQNQESLGFESKGA